MFNDFLSKYGFTNLNSSLKFELVNKEYHIISSYNDIRFPFIEKVNKFPDVIVEHRNGKKYLIFFFSPKYIEKIQQYMIMYLLQFIHICYGCYLRYQTLLIFMLITS